MRKVIILCLFTVILAQNKTLELQDVMGGTFRYDRIGSYNWVNNQDAYYFSESDSLGKHYKYAHPNAGSYVGYPYSFYC